MTAATPVLRPAANPAAVLADVGERLEQQIRAPMRVCGYDSAVIGVTDLPTAPEYYQDPNGKWWLFVTPEQDPFARVLGGRYVVPEDQYQKLHALKAAGLICEEVAVGHGPLDPATVPEDAFGRFVNRLVPATAPTQTPTPTLPPLPNERQRRRDDRFVEISGAPFKAGQRLLKGTATAVASAAATIEDLDPIVFGGIVHRGYQAVAWVEITRWDE